MSDIVVWMKREIIQEIKSKIKEIEKNLLGLGFKIEGVYFTFVYIMSLGDLPRVGKWLFGNWVCFPNELGDFGNVYKRL